MYVITIFWDRLFICNKLFIDTRSGAPLPAICHTLPYYTKYSLCIGMLPTVAVYRIAWCILSYSIGCIALYSLTLYVYTLCMYHVRVYAITVSNVCIALYSIIYV